MRHSKLNGLSVLLISLVGVLSANCGDSSSSCNTGLGIDGGGAGGTGGCAFGGASYGQPGCGSGGTGGATGGACNSVLFDNGNIAACTAPTNTSVFTLSAASTVTSLRLWTNTTISGQTVSYTLLNAAGTTLSAGPTTKGGCDPYQTNWCEFLVTMNMTLPAGTYTVKSSAVATCANSGSNNIGMVTVKGCAGSSQLPDAAIADAAGVSCNGVLFDNGNTAACTAPTNTSVFTLSAASTVTSLRLWTNTTISGQTVSYTLLNAAGTTLSAGPTTKGGCDPYQTNWCEFLVTMNMTLPAGTYTVKSSAVATCANSGSNNIGFVAVKGCAGSSQLPDAAIADAAGVSCNGVLFDNGNTAACTAPTNTSVFTLSAASTVTSLRLWTNTTISGQTVSYTLLNAAGTTLSAGPTTKGGCDPYQTNWCEFLVTMNMTLPAGTYTVKSSAVATCANSGSNNIGMVTVKGCAGSSQLPDAAIADAAGVSCNGVLFDNGNTAACTAPTNTSVFTLSAASTVTSLRLWTNTTISGQTVSYTLLNAAGTTLSAGPTTKGGCDPYQTNWCEFLVTMNMTLPAGTYTVKSSAVATCANSGSNNIGFVAVKGCAGSSSPVDAGAGDTLGGVASCNLIVNGNAEAAVGSLDGTPVATPGWTSLGEATAGQYGANGWPALTDPGPVDRGLNLFSGGLSDATSSLTQTVSVGQFASSVDAGGVTYQLSAWLGGFSSQDDNATLTVTFQNASAQSLGSGSIGPVLASERSGASGLLLRSSSGAVPPGTRSVLVVLTMTRVSGTANDGYADNLLLMFSGTGIGSCTGNASKDGGTTDSPADSGTADAPPTYFTVSTPPAGISGPVGAKISALKTTTNLAVGGIFWKDGRLFATSNSGGPIVSVMPGETGTLWANVPSLQGGNPSWRHGVPLAGGNILLAIDYYGGPTGLHEITPTGTDTAWTLAQGHSGIGDLVALPNGGGWVFSDFESYGIFKVPAKNAAETSLIPAGSPTFTPAYLAHDASTDTIYFVNMSNLGSEPWFGGDGAIYKLTTGVAPTLVASAPTGARFTGLAIGLGGPFAAGLYAADPANSRVVKVESTGILTPVVVGVPTPSEIRIDPASKGMALFSADQIIFVLP